MGIQSIFAWKAGTNPANFLEERFWVTENGKQEKFSNSGTFLTLMRMLPNGAWKITHQMWDDPPNLKQ